MTAEDAAANALVIRGLTKSYGRQVALAGLDLTVPRGVVYGFLGPNGAGKTTTMRILAGLIHRDGGSVELLGRPYAGERRRRFEIGALIESPYFYPYLSARDNLKVLGASGAAVGWRRVDELVELVGLGPRARDRVSRYSLGMKQRLGIAAALLNDPQLLLLDEPANGLDPAGIVGLREMLRSLAATGKTVFVSSHLLAEVQQLADMVGIVAHGRLVREGELESMLASQGRVRIKVRPERREAAIGALAGRLGAGRVEPEEDEAWLKVVAGAEEAEELNRLLAASDVYASGIESSSDLEALFLELTGGDTASGGSGGFGRGGGRKEEPSVTWPAAGGPAGGAA